MMFLDSRVGSKDLLDPMRRFGIPVELTTLDYGDATWLGKGPDGPLPVGVELKTIGDLLSSLVSGRLTGHQIPGMVQQYHQVWLVVEGMVKPDRETGELQQFRGSGWRPIELGRRRFTYHDFSAFLATLETKAGVHVRQTEGRWETACLLASLYRWWQKDWESHRGHLAVVQLRHYRSGARYARHRDPEDQRQLTGAVLRRWRQGFAMDRLD